MDISLNKKLILLSIASFCMVSSACLASAYDTVPLSLTGEAEEPTYNFTKPFFEGLDRYQYVCDQITGKIKTFSQLNNEAKKLMKATKDFLDCMKTDDNMYVASLSIPGRPLISYRKLREDILAVSNALLNAMRVTTPTKAQKEEQEKCWNSYSEHHMHRESLRQAVKVLLKNLEIASNYIVRIQSDLPGEAQNRAHELKVLLGDIYEWADVEANVAYNTGLNPAGYGLQVHNTIWQNLKKIVAPVREIAEPEK